LIQLDFSNERERERERERSRHLVVQAVVNPGQLQGQPRSRLQLPTGERRRRTRERREIEEKREFVFLKDVFREWINFIDSFVKIVGK
jgi:hypothetical protein